MDRHPPIGMQDTMQRFIADGHLDRHLRRSRRIDRERREVVVEFLADQVLRGTLMAVPPCNAGLHLAPELPPGMDEALAEGVAQAGR